ncbi:hypothetical protein NDN08_004332 [Rhodosorus marinus]|uniref:Uncharacterized protein n=1 Tax=Rhodosorus marinus TaxID=101924 RepID=A0AAV8UPW8_9RHOD|nr:hypothetical protein NDN08_004332 [Rhodosorus marinus]
MIVVSRALVQRLRPHIEKCERDTQDLCDHCGSQRLYFCVHEHAKEAKTSNLRGVYRTPWIGEKHTTSTEWHGYPLSLHGMKSTNPKLHHATVSLDFNELYDLALRARRRSAADAGEPYVLIEDLHFEITCKGMGYFRHGKCYSRLEPHNFWCQTSSYTWKPK